MKKTLLLTLALIATALSISFVPVDGQVLRPSEIAAKASDVPPGRVPLPMLDLEPSVVQEVGAF